MQQKQKTKRAEQLCLSLFHQLWYALWRPKHRTRSMSCNMPT